ncbi:hypothetical protein Tco_1447856 [Tanacetum coccineum]
MFLKYSTGQIPPKKSRGKGSQGKKTVDTHVADVDVSEESDSEPTRKRTASRRVVKKKVPISPANNIIHDLDVALELGKSISLTKATEEEAARQVHARIVTEYVPKPARRRTSEQEAVDTMRALKERKKTNRRQPGTRGSSEGTGRILGVLDESIVIFASSSEGTGTKPGVPDEEKVTSEENVILEWGSEQESKYSEEDQGNDDEVDWIDSDEDEEKNPLSLNLILQSFGDQFLKTSSDTSLVGIVKDITDAEINSLLDIKIQSEVPHIQSPYVLTIPVSVISDPSVLTPIPVTPSVAPTTTLLTPLYVLQRHNADLIKKYSVKPAPESSKIQKPMIDLEQESKKSSSEIHKIKREQVKKQKMPKYTIKSTDKATLKEYDQKSALYQDQHENNLFNRNPANHSIVYHDTHESYPLAGPNQGKKTKRRRTKESESSKKPSTTKETPKGKASSKGSKTGKSASAKEPIEEPIAEVAMDDVVNIAGEDVVRDDDQPHDTSEPKTYKTPNQDWFKQPPRPPTPDLEWNKRQVVLDQPEQPWFNQMVSAIKDPLTFNDLMATPIDFSKYVLNRLKIENLTQDLLLGPAYNLLKDTCTSSIELEYNFQRSAQAINLAIDYFFNNDLEYLKTSDPEKTYTTSITKTKAARSQMNKFSKHNVYFTQKIHGVKSVSVKKLHEYGNLEEIVVKRADRQLYKFKEGDFVYLHLNDIEDMLILVVQHKLFLLNKSDIVDFIVALRMFTRSLIIKRRVEDLQLGEESYQKKLNITVPQQTFLEKEFKELYTPS